MNLVSYSTQWPHLYQQEKDKLLSLLDDDIVDIQHIGSTAVPHIQSKPIVDLMVMLKSIKVVPQYLAQLQELGYEYSEKRSSNERYFFTKGDPVAVHLSLADNTTSFWKRQLLFRDYLLNNPKVAKEYEQLKVDLIKKYPSGKDEYSYGKSAFVENILKKVEKISTK